MVGVERVKDGGEEDGGGMGRWCVVGPVKIQSPKKGCRRLRTYPSFRLFLHSHPTLVLMERPKYVRRLTFSSVIVPDVLEALYGSHNTVVSSEGRSVGDAATDVGNASSLSSGHPKPAQSPYRWFRIYPWPGGVIDRRCPP